MFKEFEEQNQRGFGDFDYNLSKKQKQELQKGWPGYFYQNIFQEIDENKFAILYSHNRGRPNFPVKILVALEILKHKFDLSDKQLIDNFNNDIRFMKAVGLNNVGQITVAERTVYDFRERIVKHSNETGHNLITEVFEDLTEHMLNLADLDADIQRMDSTMVDANIKHLSRIELMRRTLANFVSDLDKNKQKRIHKNILSVLEEDNFQEYFDDFSKKEVRERLLGKLQNIKQQFKNDEQINQLQSYELICQLIDDQTIETSDQLKDDADISADSLQSPYDKDATYRNKGGSSSQGYSVNISETAAPDNPVQMITDLSVEPNIKSDVSFLKDRLPEINFRTDIEQLVIDAAYYGPETQKTAQKQTVELIPTDLTGQKPQYSTADFVLNSKQGIKSCPVGIKPTKSKYLTQSDSYAAWFKKSDCQGCSYKDKCPIQEQKKDMTVRFTKQRHERDTMRLLHNSKEYKKLKQSRAAVEGTISALKRAYGLDKFSVTGLVKTKINSYYKALSYNLNQLLRLSKGQSRPSYST